MKSIENGNIFPIKGKELFRKKERDDALRSLERAIENALDRGDITIRDIEETIEGVKRKREVEGEVAI